MPRSLQDFYSDVGVELGVSGPDAALSAEDLAVISDSYVPLWQLLNADGLVTWTQSGDIPDDALFALTWLLAFAVSQKFGINGPKLQELRERGQYGGPAPSLGERLLRKRAAANYIPSSVPLPFY
jgi:hypothetical protein